MALLQYHIYFGNVYYYDYEIYEFVGTAKITFKYLNTGVNDIVIEKVKRIMTKYFQIVKIARWKCLKISQQRRGTEDPLLFGKFVIIIKGPSIIIIIYAYDNFYRKRGEGVENDDRYRNHLF